MVHPRQGESMRRVSKFLALVLRHRPEVAKLSLSPEGWAEVDEVVAAIRAKFGTFDRGGLEELVRTDAKSRYALDESGEKIRASQGHSVPVDLGLEPAEPPLFLYHGTAQRFLASILEEGLVRAKRHHVHLSPDVETALKVARRRGGEVAVIEVRSGEMAAPFFRSANGVWLTDHVPPAYLRVLPLSTPPR